MTEDWRILRALSLYRILLDILLLILFESGVGADLFGQIAASWFHVSCVVYAIAGLLLLFPVMYRRPRIEWQAPVHWVVDVAAILSLVYASGGISSRLGILMITPVIGCSVVLERRWAMMLPALTVAALVTEEVLRASPHYGTSDFSGAVLLGAILMISTFGASTVAQRARRSEALAARVGSEFKNLSQLNQRIIENLSTGVLVVDDQDRAHMLNTAAKLQLGARRDDTQVPVTVFPGLLRSLQQWRTNPLRESAPVVPRGGAAELLPRILPLGTQPGGSMLVLLDETSRLREQAQQMKLAALGRLSASIAHEIRNPLSAINHAAQLLGESDQMAEGDRRLISIIERHTGRIDKIINDVLNLSRRREAAPTVFDLGNWLMRTVELYGEGHPDRRAQFTLSLPPGSLRVRFDPSQLQQILFNLWDNSFAHAGREAATVHIALTASLIGPGTRQPCLEISDDGPGIPDELLDRVFEPFFTTAHQGTGLGLYLARELCEYNQARLEYLKRGTGACFRLIFAGAEDTTP